jgi:hypothetical protein
MVPVAALMLVGGCKYKVERFCDDNTPCTDPESPFCDRNGEFGGIGNQCIPNPFDAAAQGSCQPNSVSCEDGVRTVCGSDGFPELTDQCLLGCRGDDTCAVIEPSNDHQASLAAAVDAPSVTLDSGATINTDTGLIRDGDGRTVTVPFTMLPAPEGTGTSTGVPLGLFLFHDLTVGSLAVEGEAALVILSYGELTVRGLIDISAKDEPAPGALSGCSGEGRRGGVGFRSPGAAGGCFNIQAGGQGGTGGAAFALSPKVGACNPGKESLIPLRGGCSGAAIEGSTREGGGGGAVQLVSNTRIVFLDRGGVVAGGAGGFRDDAEMGSGGAGGGAGGGVLLEAPSLIFEAGSGIAANGGGGGSYVQRGGDADTLTVLPAPGGQSTVSHKGSGGHGASLSALDPENGQSVSSEVDIDDPETAAGGGGGGGTVGRIRINTLSGTLEVPPGVILSPEPSIGQLVIQE